MLAFSPVMAWGITHAPAPPHIKGCLCVEHGFECEELVPGI